jgi:hypothetical protein
MPRLKGLGNIVAELRAERAHLVNNLRHVDAALAVLGKLGGREVRDRVAPYSFGDGSPKNRSRPESALGESQGEAGEEIGYCVASRLPKKVVWRGIKPQRLKAGLIFSTYGMPGGIP